MRTSTTIAGLLALLLAAGKPLLAVEVPKDPQEALKLARQEKKLGIEKLTKAKQGGPEEAGLARQALKHFESAQALYDFVAEKQGESEALEEEISDLQSLLYWCRKMTPLKDEEAAPPPPPEPADDPDTGDEAPPKPAPPPPPPPEPAPAPPAPKPEDRAGEARKLLAEAEAYAAAHPEERMQVVARFFRIADLYKDTPDGPKALERAMEIARSWTGLPAGSPGAGAADATLLRLGLRHADPAVRIANLETLVKLAPKEAVGDLHAMFCEETDRGVRDAVIRHLAALKDKRTLDSLQAFSAVKDRTVAEDTVRLIASVGQEKHVRFMVYAILYHEPRLCAPWEAKQGDALDAYVEAVRSAYASGLRRLVADAAKGMGETGVKGLEKLFETRGLATREAILALGAMGSVKSANKIVIYLAKGRA
ncbi:MAG: HEAT repeat domain-containing protein, partial [Planctomycetes bacterium]|nr:HEAT repeat domain-containing protein [Planctomycetota bacterium]